MTLTVGQKDTYQLFKYSFVYRVTKIVFFFLVTAVHQWATERMVQHIALLYIQDADRNTNSINIYMLLRLLFVLVQWTNRYALEIRILSGCNRFKLFHCSGFRFFDRGFMRQLFPHGYHSVQYGAPVPISILRLLCQGGEYDRVHGMDNLLFVRTIQFRITSDHFIWRESMQKSTPIVDYVHIQSSW